MFTSIKALQAKRGAFTNLVAVSAAFLLLAAVPVASYAQEITSVIRGTVTSPDGVPQAGASVTVTDTRTGQTRSVTTGTSGTFSVRGLTVGGPFTVRIEDENFKSTQINDVFTSLSGATDFNIVLEAGEAIEEIVTVASMVETADTAIGPSSTFNFEQINSLPSISRQIRDIVRVDPRVSIGRTDGGNGNGITCLGGSNRSNNFTIDGIASADGFGLNASGNSSRNTFPVPFDAVSSAAVEFAPVSVTYGRFTGCNVNVVTRSGTNEFSGSAFYLFNDNDTTADELDGSDINTLPFEDKVFGLDFGGPIIKDKLFFYVAYEENDEFDTFDIGPIGASGFANNDFATLADVNEFRDILISEYGRDPGEIVRQQPQTAERTFARFDWNINELHRAEFTYTQLEERNLEPDGFGGFLGFHLSNSFELEGTDQEAISARVYSDWTDRFSTEVRLSSLEVNDIQGPLGGGEAQSDNPRVRLEVRTPDSFIADGPGIFRSANQLDYTLDQFKLTGFYNFDNHQLTFGYDLDSLDIFNLFIVNATGTLEFDSLADLRAGSASAVEKDGSFSGNPFDAAAEFSRDIHAFYIQDEFSFNDEITVVAGLRYETYASDDQPRENPVFIQRYGFSNTQAYDGLDLLMPRLGITWEPLNLGETTFNFGYGRFSGGDPTVHFANSYQNSGALIGDADFELGDSGPCTDADLQVISNGTFTGIPTCIENAIQASANANQGRVAATSPDFELPYVDRFNFGVTHTTDLDIAFLSDWNIQFDYIHSEFGNSAEWYDLTLTANVDANGFPIILPDGRPQFNAIDPLLPGCTATFLGAGQGFVGTTQACDAGGDDQDILLANGPEGSSDVFSLQLSKLFDLTSRTTLDVRFGYANTDTKIGNPANSSTATSSFEEVATAVLNNNVIAPAQYANKHNIVLAMNLDHYFIEDAATSVGFFMRRRSGRPFSYTYDNNTPTSLFGDSDNEERNLFYVPTGPSDPLVDFSTLDAQGTTDDFFAYLASTGLNAYAGQISPRNAFEQPWTTDIDVRIAQEIPLPGADHRLNVFLDIENILNLFGDDNNLQTFKAAGDVSEGVPVLDAALSTDGTQYIYSNFNPSGRNFNNPSCESCANDEFLDTDDSAWRIQIGVRYTFGR